MKFVDIEYLYTVHHNRRRPIKFVIPFETSLYIFNHHKKVEVILAMFSCLSVEIMSENTLFYIVLRNYVNMFLRTSRT